MAQTKPRGTRQSGGKATATKGKEKTKASGPLPGSLTPEDLVDIFTRMVLARTADERIWALNRQGKVPIAASSQGHEAAQLGSLLAAEKDGHCFLFPYYRDLALKMSAGLTPTQVMKSFMGKAGEPYSNARQFPLQGADLPNNIIQISNVVSAGLTQGAGYALGCKMLGDETVVLVYFGDGGSSQGETHEAMNFAGIHHLPIIFVCENNRYAISVPQSQQMAIDDIYSRSSSYGFPGFAVDGMDLIQCYEATREAINHARSEGPVLLEMRVERFMPHTTDDDDRRYRPAEEVEAARKLDPVLTMASVLVDQGLLDQQEVENIKARAQQAINEATDAADAAELPDVSTINDMVYAP